MVFGTYREGDRGVFALDVTQPDPVESLNILNFAGQPDIAWVPTTHDGPGCANSAAPASGCGTLSYPAQLWEFQDKCLAVGSSASAHRHATRSSGSSTTPCLAPDTSGNESLAVVRRGQQRQARSRLLVVAGQHRPHPGQRRGRGRPGGQVRGHLRRRPRPRRQSGVGNWIYMVDVETGKAIYKRQVASARAQRAGRRRHRPGRLHRHALRRHRRRAAVQGRHVDTRRRRRRRPGASTTPRSGGRSRSSTPAAGVRPIFYPPTVTFVASQGPVRPRLRHRRPRGPVHRRRLAEPEGRFYLILDRGFQRGCRSAVGRSADRVVVPADRRAVR